MRRSTSNANLSVTRVPSCLFAIVPNVGLSTTSSVAPLSLLGVLLESGHRVFQRVLTFGHDGH
jgi:hypothetical protein